MRPESPEEQTAVDYRDFGEIRGPRELFPAQYIPGLEKGADRWLDSQSPTRTSIVTTVPDVDTMKCRSVSARVGGHGYTPRSIGARIASISERSNVMSLVAPLSTVLAIFFLRSWSSSMRSSIVPEAMSL